MDDRVIIKEFNMEVFKNRKKTIRILLPKDYYETKKKYPVIYMHDGQNLIDKSPYSNCSWDVLKTTDEYHSISKGIIIVGMDNHETKRILEYSPFISKNVEKYLNKKVGISQEEIRPEADFYGEFIVKQLKPFIDLEYRTKSGKENTFIAGSSCGGIISAYLGLKYQNIFSVIGAFSPAYNFVGNAFYDYVRNTDIQEHIKIYHDMGTKEGGIFSFIDIISQNKFHKIITSKMNENNILKITDKGATHSECYWAKRFRDFLKFCFD
ncbi:alpha/beta hydrolase-fold protein [Mycoplasmatota bacterium WC30]